MEFMTAENVGAFLTIVGTISTSIFFLLRWTVKQTSDQIKELREQLEQTRLEAAAERERREETERKLDEADEARHQLEIVQQATKATLQQHEARISDLRHQMAKMDGRAEEREKHISMLSDDLRQSHETNGALRKADQDKSEEITRLRSENGRLANLVEDRKKDAGEWKAKAETHLKDCEELRAVLDSMRTELADTKKALKACKEHNDVLQVKVNAQGKAGKNPIEATKPHSEVKESSTEGKNDQ